MIDRRTLRGLLKDMEHAAEEALQQDSSFLEVLQALKWEIDSDSRVQSAVRGLHAAGQRVFSSFVPRIRVRIKKGESVFILPKPQEISAFSDTAPVSMLTQQLKDAASAVIKTSRHCQELERIVNEAVAASSSFEKLASQVENAGHEVLISLDLSAYAQVRESAARPERAATIDSPPELPKTEFSAKDRDFLKAIGIKAH